MKKIISSVGNFCLGFLFRQFLPRLPYEIRAHKLTLVLYIRLSTVQDSTLLPRQKLFTEAIIFYIVEVFVLLG